MNIKFILLVVGVLNGSCIITKKSQLYYTSASIFAHNDYEKSKPFYNAYQHRVGFIEADIFSLRDTLFVAHEINQITTTRTLENMYLQVIDSILVKNKGKIYPHSNSTLTLSIDLKTKGTTTLPHLIKVLNVYPSIIKSSAIKIMISGDMPEPTQWHLFPDYIYFDGRPDKKYTPDQWKRIWIVSNSFSKYTSWNGIGSIPEPDKLNILGAIQIARDQGKKFRFWGNPDKSVVWNFLIKNRVEVLGTDRVDEMVEYLKK